MDTEASTGMPSQYDPRATEQRWYREWLARGLFHAAPSAREPYTIVLPPPNVTGSLHMGHALNHTMQDVLIRRARMQGREALFLPGTDHAGIATQVVVERELAKGGIDRRQMGREAFLERVWQWKEQYGGRIVEQMQKLGESADWDRLRFTMDEGLSRAVRVAFVRMYQDGLIYRGERIINWCPRDHTALSDSEVEHEDVEGELVTFRYDLTDGSGHIDVATTRVETMLGDTGIAVHPSDERYAAFVGRTVTHPFDGRELPIVADPAVDPAFGTGAVKVTPAHDPTDFEIGERTGLPMMNVLTADARVSDAAAVRFRGLDRYDARRAVLEALREQDRVISEERPYVHAVGHCYRCHTEIEPWLSGKQWFVAVERLKAPALEAARDGRVTFHPARWRDNYVQWLEGLRDWNISRQLWWGHRIPVWYCPNGHEFASIEDPTVCASCGAGDLQQDPDVLDTWFSSQLWPFSTLGWPDETEDLKFFYPTTVLVTGYEILYLWVARMVMSGLYLMGDIPFSDVVITGLVRDAQGRKMSKSLGNVIDPLDLIARHGADATRFALMRLATGTQEIPFGEDAVEAARHFANKIWNAARLVLGAWPGGARELPPREDWTLTERWLLSRHQACVAEVGAALEAYRFADAAVSIHRFLWSEYCDWALEMEKPRLYDGEARVLAWVLERTLRLLHPIMPFVTEEVWQRLAGGDDASIVIAAAPGPQPEHVDAAAEEAFAEVQELVSRTRRIRALIGAGQGFELAIEAGRAAALEALREPVERLAGAAVRVGEPAGRAVPLGLRGGEAWLAVPEAFDPAPVLAGRRKTLEDLRRKLATSDAKLANAGFTGRAGADVVERERRKNAELREEAAAVEEQVSMLEGIH